MVIDYVKKFYSSMPDTGSVNNSVESIIIQLIEDGVDRGEAEKIIYEICMRIFDDGKRHAGKWVNEYRKLCLQKSGCQTADNFPDPMNVEQFAQCIGQSLQWCYNNTEIIPKTQNKRGGKMVFYKRDVDKWQAKRLNKEAR